MLKPSVLKEKVLPSDYIAGQETGVEFFERTKDWRQFRPTEERQKKLIETKNCTVFSALNSIEEQIKYLISTGELVGDNLKKLEDLGFFDENGNFNASDRFTGFTSGTTIYGNYMSAPLESIRKDGLLPEKDWPFDEKFTWNEYYKEPGVERREKAKKILEILDFNWERLWTDSDGWSEYQRNLIEKHISQAPICVATPVCPGWNNGAMVSPCGKTNGEHATIIDNIDLLDKFFYDFDSYYPFGKTLSKYYLITTAIKGVVTVKKPIVIPPEEKYHYCFTKTLKIGDRNEEVKALQKALKIDGCFPVKVIETGYYGEITRQAVKKFQEKYQVANKIELAIVNGKTVGGKTRNKLNSLFNK